MLEWYFEPRSREHAALDIKGSLPRPPPPPAAAAAGPPPLTQPECQRLPAAGLPPGDATERPRAHWQRTEGTGLCALCCCYSACHCPGHCQSPSDTRRAWHEGCSTWGPAPPAGRTLPVTCAWGAPGHRRLGVGALATHWQGPRLASWCQGTAIELGTSLRLPVTGSLSGRIRVRVSLLKATRAHVAQCQRAPCHLRCQ